MPLERYRARAWFFVTTCVEDRRPVLVGKLVDELVEHTRREARRCGFAIYAYCVMPDHFHLLVYPMDDHTDLISFASGVKQATGYAFRQRTGRKLWQKSFYDHVLREQEDEKAVAYYLWMNPVRKRLCLDPRQWPGSGSFVVDWAKCLTPPEEFWVPPWKRSGTLQGSTGVGAGTEACDFPTGNLHRS